MRGVRGKALQEGRAGGEAARQLDPRRARVDGGPGARAVPPPAAPRPRVVAPAAGGARLPPAGPARHHAVGRRGPAPEDRARARAHEGPEGAQALHPRRAHDRPPPGRRAYPVPRARSAGGRRAQRARDRASPRRHQARRLDRRAGAGRRRGGGTRRSRGDTGGGGQGGGIAHGPVPAGPRVTRRQADLALLGALVAVGFISVTLGLVITTPSRSAFIVAISSVLAPVIGFVVLGQRPAWF